MLSPVAMEAAERVLREDLLDIDQGMARMHLVADAMSALEGADAPLVVTEWKQFHDPDFALVRDMLKYR